MSFTLNERDRRFQAVRENMRNEGLDALIVFGCTGTGIPRNGNYTYLTNHTLIYASALLFFPLEGEPTAFVPGENQLLDARRSTWIDDARLSRQLASDLCKHIASIRRSLSHIGISSLDALPVSTLQHIQAALPDIKFSDAGSVIFAAREAKSDEEIALARRGAEIADLGLKRSLEILRPGLTELEWKAQMEEAMTAEGANGGFNMLGVGRPDGADDVFRGFVVPPTKREFRDGDLALLEISPRVEGYFSQMVRLVSLGEPCQSILKAHDACIRAKRRALGELKAGTSFGQVAQSIHDALASDGYQMKGVGSAHTIGLDLSETIINLKSPGRVKDRMLVTMHPMLEMAEWRQLFVGETYLVNGSNLESLTQFDDEIIVLN